jgi:pimeloyl-ACP methyl ester carboxylesterase
MVGAQGLRPGLAVELILAQIKRFRVNGHWLHVELSGPPDGEPVILLHHGLGAASSWDDQVPALVEAGFRVAAYDRWGYGRSDPRPALDVPAFEADQAGLLGLLDRLGFRQVNLVGHSDGGTIALLIAARCPERVKRLAVVAAHIYLEAQTQTGIRDTVQAYQEKFRMRKGLARLHGAKAVGVFQHWSSAWLEGRLEGWDLRPLLGRIRCPAFVIQGSQDEYATPQQAIDLAAALPGAGLWLADGAGHRLPEDQAEEFNRRLVAFLKRPVEAGQPVEVLNVQ